MTKVTKVSDKLVRVSEAFTVNMYDNGFMVEVSGRNKKEDWTSAKIVVSTAEELIEIIREVSTMERE